MMQCGTPRQREPSFAPRGRGSTGQRRDHLLPVRFFLRLPLPQKHNERNRKRLVIKTEAHTSAQTTLNSCFIRLETDSLRVEMELQTDIRKIRTSLLEIDAVLTKSTRGRTDKRSADFSPISVSQSRMRTSDLREIFGSRTGIIGWLNSRRERFPSVDRNYVGLEF